MPDVFISYSTKNTDIMETVVNHLEKNGIKCWFAPRDIAPSQEWVPAIQEALRVTKIFVLIYTEDSNASKQVMNEVALAFNAEKIILPFCLTEEKMNYELEYYLTRVHWLNAVSVPLEESLEELRKYVEMGLHPTQEPSARPDAVRSQVPQGGETPQTTRQPGGSAVKSGAEAKKKGKIALWAGIAAAALLCVILGAFAISRIDFAKPQDLMEAGRKAFYYGERTPADAQKAWNNFERAAAKGEADAYYYLGQLKEWDFDFKAAIDYYEQGIDKNSELARIALGYVYQRGFGVKADFNKAWQLYCEAAENDLVEADYYRGKFIRAGLAGTEVDTAQAVKYFKNVINNSKIDYFVNLAHNEIGALYKIGSSDFPKDYEAAIKEFEKIDEDEKSPYMQCLKKHNLALTYQAMRQEVTAEEYYTQCFDQYREMAQEGSIYGMIQIGKCYRYGNGTKKDLAEARKWFLAADAAVKEKNPKACCFEAVYTIGITYVISDKSQEADLDKAMECFKEAANAGYGLAACAVGDMYFNGHIGTDQDGNPDVELARQWYEKAIDQGETEAYCNIGNIYAQGTEKVEADPEEAKRWYLLGANAGSTSCMYNVALQYQKAEDYNTAFSWLQKAADLGHVASCAMIGLYYKDGYAGVKDDELAMHWLLIAADEGHVDSIELVADAYFYGRLSQEINYAEAFRYAMRGCEAENAKCLYLCGRLYNKGLGTEKNQKLAAQCFIQAAELGNVEAMEEYGELMLNGGVGVERDEAEGIRWLETSINQGSLVAMAALGDYYYNKEDYNRAFPLYKKLSEYNLGVGELYLKLGHMYLYELGTTYDEAQAANWLAQAYDAGEYLDAYESYFLGVCYFYGLNLATDEDKGFLLFKRSVDQTYTANNTMMLGLCYYGGLGTEVDYQEAFQYFAIALDMGGLEEDEEGFCRNAIRNMVEKGFISREAAQPWL